jgi:hypothetical protein
VSGVLDLVLTLVVSEEEENSVEKEDVVVSATV